MTDTRTPADLVAEILSHACDRVAKPMLRARGCADPARVIAEGLFAAALARAKDIPPGGTVGVVRLSPANDLIRAPRGEFGEELLD